MLSVGKKCSLKNLYAVLHSQWRQDLQFSDQAPGSKILKLKGNLEGGGATALVWRMEIAALGLSVTSSKHYPRNRILQRRRNERMGPPTN